VSAKRLERLEKTLARVAREQGLNQERLRRWVSFLALCGVLEHAVEKGVIETYYLKGGVAMELRFAGAARTTKDFDLGLEGSRTERIRRLEEVLQLGFDEFTFRLKPAMHQMELADTVRIEVAAHYRTRAWQTVDIDLGPGEAREVDLLEPAIAGLVEMGLPMTPRVRCLGINAGGPKASCLHGTAPRGPGAGCSGYPAGGHAGQARLCTNASRGGADFHGASHSCLSSQYRTAGGVATGTGEHGPGAGVPCYECRRD